MNVHELSNLIRSFNLNTPAPGDDKGISSNEQARIEEQAQAMFADLSGAARAKKIVDVADAFRVQGLKEPDAGALQQSALAFAREHLENNPTLVFPPYGTSNDYDRWNVVRARLRLLALVAKPDAPDVDRLVGEIGRSLVDNDGAASICGILFHMAGQRRQLPAVTHRDEVQRDLRLGLARLLRTLRPPSQFMDYDAAELLAAAENEAEWVVLRDWTLGSAESHGPLDAEESGSLPWNVLHRAAAAGSSPVDLGAERANLVAADVMALPAVPASSTDAGLVVARHMAEGRPSADQLMASLMPWVESERADALSFWVADIDAALEIARAGYPAASMAAPGAPLILLPVTRDQVETLEQVRHRIQEIILTPQIAGGDPQAAWNEILTRRNFIRRPEDEQILVDQIARAIEGEHAVDLCADILHRAGGREFSELELGMARLLRDIAPPTARRAQEAASVIAAAEGARAWKVLHDWVEKYTTEHGKIQDSRAYLNVMREVLEGAADAGSDPAEARAVFAAAYAPPEQAASFDDVCALVAAHLAGGAPRGLRQEEALRRIAPYAQEWEQLGSVYDAIEDAAAGNAAAIARYPYLLPRSEPEQEFLVAVQTALADAHVAPFVSP